MFTNILIIDLYNMFSKELVEAFKVSCCNVDVCENLENIELKYDVVIITLNNFTNSSIIKNMKSKIRERNNFIPIICMSENLYEKSILMLLNIKVDDFVFKNDPIFKIIARVKAHARSSFALLEKVNKLELSNFAFQKSERRLSIGCFFYDSVDFIDRISLENPEIIMFCSVQESVPECDIFIINASSIKSVKCAISLRRESEKRYVPILFSYKNMTDEAMKDFLEFGLCDFIDENASKYESTLRIQTYIRYKILYENVLTLIQQNIKLNNMDSLTETYNKSYLMNYKSNNDNFSICMIDINDFKFVNDNLGHVQGDIILRKIANILKKAIRNTDVVFRFGGDEFVLILHRSDIEKSVCTMERINKNIVKYGKEIGINISISFGMSYCSEAFEIQKLIEIADARMYENKKNKSNNIYIAECNLLKWLN